jgi:hypothetical protein
MLPRLGGHATVTVPGYRPRRSPRARPQPARAGMGADHRDVDSHRRLPERPDRNVRDDRERRRTVSALDHDSAVAPIAVRTHYAGRLPQFDNRLLCAHRRPNALLLSLAEEQEHLLARGQQVPRRR